jgi:hypothetical protein
MCKYLASCEREKIMRTFQNINKIKVKKKLSKKITM